ncbi:MAG TPA: glycosyltransferase family 39 protein [Pseudomonadales bacterium]|nr:glycosyltransferase family 39 protein [Pseudomonadales bacterium]
MDNTKTEAPKHSPFELWAWLGVLIVLLLVGFVRYRLLDMPLERDEGEYACAGQLLLQGIPPYQLAWNMKLPGTYFMYALGMAVFGQTAAGIHATLMVVNSLTIIFVFVLARRLFGALAGVAACAAFGILSVSPAVMGMAAHANHFVIFFAVWGTLLLWRGEEFYRWSFFFFSGVLYGLALLMKQQGICFCLFAVTMVVWNGFRNRAIFSTVFFRKILFLGIGMILPLAATYKGLQLAGVLPKFWFWTYTYAASYAMEVTPGEGLTRFVDYAEKKWLIYFALLGFILVSLPFVMRDRAYRNQILFAAAFLFFSIFGVAIDLNFREHYFILLLPALGLFVGLAIVALQYATANRFLKIIPPLVCLMVLGWTVYAQREFYFQLPANTISRIVYSGDTPFVDMPAVGDYIRTNSSTSATVAVIGSEPEIYFYAHRRPATGYLYMYALMEPQPFATQMQYEMINEIQTNKPEFLVYITNPDSWNVRPASDQTVLKWFSQYTTNYDKVLALDPVTTVPDKTGKNVATTNIDAIIYKIK